MPRAKRFSAATAVITAAEATNSSVIIQKHPRCSAIARRSVHGPVVDRAGERASPGRSGSGGAPGAGNNRVASPGTGAPLEG